MNELAGYVRAGGWLGRDARHYSSVGSTNDVALAAAAEGAAEGLVVLAEVQTAGRGRLQRRWQAPAGCCLLFSALFRPPEPFAYHATRTLMAVGLGLREAVWSVAGVRAQLKWPNDLIVSGGDGGWCKLAGMLSEVTLSDAGLLEAPIAQGGLVVGVGLNVNVPPELLPGLAPNAGSLLALTGQVVSRVALLAHVLAGAERRVDALRRGIDLLPEWREALAWIGERVEVQGAGERLAGVAEGVDAEGALLLRLESGELRTFTAGDVTLRQV
jgi:BirA family transcriptional regulator, biotin operon repressor / biotin---[acetyl-CoA-carboxylase] ligase